MEAVAEWAIATGRYQRQPMTLFQQCKRELSRAVQQSLFKDPQGREVRRLHPVRLSGDGGPIVIWGDLTTAKPPHMHLSQQQGRQAIAADVFRHKDVTHSYNDNNRYNATLSPATPIPTLMLTSVSSQRIIPTRNRTATRTCPNVP